MLARAYARRVLAALGQAEPERVVEARRAAYARVPALVRARARRHVQELTAAAIHESALGGDEPHVHRLALLVSLGQSASPDDVAAVRAAFDVARGALGGEVAGAWRRTLAGGLVALALAAVALGWWLRDPYAVLHETAEVSESAYVRGGRPDPGSDEARRVFSDAVPAFVVALDRLARARAEGAPADAERSALLEAFRAATSDAEAALGADRGSFLRAVLEQSIAIEGAPAAEAATSSHARTADALNAALEEANLGLWLDVQVWRAGGGPSRVVLTSFGVEDVVLYASGPLAVRVLRVRRLDGLSYDPARLGFTRPEIRDAVVLLDRIERHLVRYVLPAVAREPLPLAADLAAMADATSALAAAMGDELLGTSDDARALVELLAERRRIVESLEGEMARSRVHMSVPDSYGIGELLLVQAEALVPHPDWRRVRAIEAELRAESAQRAFRAIRDRVAEATDLHEAQHRLDFVSDVLTRMPPELERWVGPLGPGEALSSHAGHALAELSAHLSAIARAEGLSRTTLGMLAVFVLDDGGWGTAESYAALVVLDELARTLGLPARDLVVGRGLDRGAVVERLRELFTRGSSALAAAARTSWERLFARPLPPLVRTSG